MIAETAAADVGMIRYPEAVRPSVGRAAGGAVDGARTGLHAPAPGNVADLVLPGGGGMDVPAGADPQAWLNLSAEERAFFARLADEGRLSYGPQDRAGDAQLYRGRHLSIRV